MPSSAILFSGTSVDITPNEPVPLWGYGGRAEAYTSIVSRLEANAVLLRCESAALLFVSVDLLFVSLALRDAVEGAAARLGIDSHAVFVTASHTHFAPVVDGTKPRLGVLDKAYERLLISRIEVLLRDLFSRSPVPAVVERSSVELPENIGRRRQWSWPTLTRRGFQFGPSVVMAPSPLQVRDTSLVALRVLNAERRPIAVLWKYACHPVAFPDWLAVSSEFPGLARDRLRAEVGRDIPVVFWQGFSGDVRPRITGSQSVVALLRSARGGPSFGAVSRVEWGDWANRIARALVQAVKSADASPLCVPFVSSFVDLPAENFVDDALNPHVRQQSVRVHLVRWREGDEALFVGAEVCSPFLSLLGTDKAICVGCVGPVLGYLASEEQVSSGGYEVEGFVQPFGLRGTVKRSAEGKVVEAVRLLRERLAAG